MKRFGIYIFTVIIFGFSGLLSTNVLADEYSDHDCSNWHSTCDSYGEWGTGRNEGKQCLGAIQSCEDSCALNPSEPDCPPSSSCSNTCGWTTPSNPSCSTCLLPDCPVPLLDSDPSILGVDLDLENFRTCRNADADCTGDSNYDSCFEPYSAQPTVSVLSMSNTTTDLGFSYIKRTGAQLNNPMEYKITVTDANGQGDIESFYIWFTDTNVPTTPTTYLPSPVGAVMTSNSDTSFGLMYHKEGSNWVPYNANYSGATSVWSRYNWSNFSNTVLIDSSGNNVATVNGVSVNNVLNGYEFTIRVNPSNGSNSMLNGNYNIYTQANDVFSFTPVDNYPELEDLDPASYANIRDYFTDNAIRINNSWSDTGLDWFIDLTEPTVNDLTVESRGVDYPSDVTLSWDIQDDLDISKVVINAFGSSDLTPSTISYNGYSFTPDYLSDDTYRGVIGHSKSFTVDYPARPLSLDNITDSIFVNIGDNKGGSLIFVITAFDSAGNYYQAEETISLEDWLITKGNFVYSSNGIGFDIKSLSSGLWTSIADLNSKGFLSEKADISTELYGGSISGLIHASINNSYTFANLDTTESILYYNQMLAQFNSRRGRIDNLQSLTLGSTLTGNLCSSNCSTNFYYGVREGSLNVNNFVCNGRGVIFVNGDLIIQPDILNTNANRDACTFVVSGDVNITAGNYNSASSLEYDQVNAYIIADGLITLESDGGSAGSRKDGLYINGGLISNSSSPVVFERFLRLADKSLYPAVVIDAHEKYGYISKLAFGSKIEIIRTEVGYKPN